jgi:hypothetical protein
MDDKSKKLLKDLGMCYPGRCWANTQPNLYPAWRKCKRGDWMVMVLVSS